MSQDRDDPIRVLFDNVLLEVDLPLEADQGSGAESVREFAREHGVADVDRMALSIGNASSGLVRVTCPGSTIPIASVYHDPECRILDVIDEDDLKLLLKLSNQSSEDTASPPAEDTAAGSPADEESAEPKSDAAEDTGESKESKDTTEASKPAPGDKPPPAGKPAEPLALTFSASALTRGDFTLDLWVFPTEPGADPPAAGSGAALTVVDGKPAFFLEGHCLAGAHALTPGRWHHLAWRHDARDDELLSFVDGVPDSLASPWSESKQAPPSGKVTLGHLEDFNLSGKVRTGREIGERAARPPEEPSTGSDGDEPEPPGDDNPGGAEKPPENPKPGVGPNDPGNAGSGDDAGADPDKSQETSESSEDTSGSADESDKPTGNSESDPAESAETAEASDESSEQGREGDKPEEPADSPAGETKPIVFLPPDILTADLPTGDWQGAGPASGTWTGTDFKLTNANSVYTLESPAEGKLAVNLLGAFQVDLALTIEEMTIEGGVDAPALSARLKLGRLADKLNGIVPGNPVTFLPEVDFALTVDGTGAVSFQLLSAPFTLQAAGMSLEPAENHTFMLNLADFGAFQLDAPVFSHQEGVFSAEGKITVQRPPAFSSKPVKAALNHLKLKAPADLLPEILSSQKPENIVAPDPAPPGWSDFAAVEPPTTVHYSIRYVSNAGFTCDFFVPRDQPVKLVFSGQGATVGVKLFGLGFGSITDQFNLTIDAETELFITGDTAPVSNPLTETNCKLTTSELVLMFTGNASAGYVPIPMFYESLVFERTGREGMKLETLGTLPMPALTEAAALIGAVREFLTDPDVVLWEGELTDLPLDFTLGGTFLQMPAGGVTFGKTGTVLNLSGDDLIDLFNAFKIPSLNAFLNLLPKEAAAGGDALALFFLNADLSWALAAPESFTDALSDPTGFATAAADWKLPRPMTDLVANLFGAIDPSAAVDTAEKAADAVPDVTEPEVPDTPEVPSEPEVPEMSTGF
ncbi:MAG: hypothetical protein QNK37_05000 [Acidobacteriota bacterium]|nr:hypothetical protein [Acidobacteriota bacterium]